MTLNEAKAVIYGNVVYACEKAGFPPETTQLVQEACDTIIALADACETIITLADRKTESQADIHDFTDCDFCKDRNCKDCEGGKDEPQINGYQTFNGTSVYISRLEDESQTERHLPDYSYEANLGRRIIEQTMRDENYIYAYDKTHGEWYPIQEIERPCDNCQEWDCYGCDYKQVKRSKE